MSRSGETRRPAGPRERNEAAGSAGAPPAAPAAEGAALEPEGPGQAVEPAAAGETASATPPAAGPGEATDPAGVFKDRWLRAEAELQNFRRRASREWDEARRVAEERVMLEMIAAIDDLERAHEAAREAGAPASWTEGVRLTAQRMREYLARQGVVVLEPVGEKFDPAFHEAMLEIDAPAGRSAGEVVQVVLKGYARGERALRPARVVVARAPAEGGSPAERDV